MGTPSSCDVCRSGKQIFLIVDGDFPDEVAIPAAERFDELLQWDREPIEFVALVKNMGKYGTPGRKAWQQSLASARSRITLVTIQCDSAIVRMASSAICLYAGLKLRFIEDSQEFAHLLPQPNAHKAS